MLILAIWSMSYSMSIGQNEQVELTFLGTAGWIISSDNTVILVDPYISRLKLGSGPSIHPDDRRRAFTRNDFYESDTIAIDTIISKADYILVHHSHFDHLSDVPYIARKTGAKVIGSSTTCQILKAYGIPETQLYRIRGGEDYQFDDVSFRVIPSLHSPLNEKRYFDDRELPEELSAPLRIADFVEGGSFMFLIRLGDHEILTMGSMNFIEREIEGLRPDILFAGANLSHLQIYNYTERLMKATGHPSIVIPVHWDNFRIPFGFSQKEALARKVKPFSEEVKSSSPNSKFLIPHHLTPIMVDANDYK